MEKLKKNKGGRPKKYTKEYLRELGAELLAFFEDEKNFWLKDFCIKKGFPSEYLSVYAKEDEEFSQTLKKAREIQEARLVQKGMERGANQAFVIFTLKNVANWRDKIENEHTGKDGKAIRVEWV